MIKRIYKPSNYLNPHKNVKVDWLVLCPCDKADAMDNPKLVVELRTLGFNKYDHGEIIVRTRAENVEENTRLINTFGRMFAEGERFDNCQVHCIDNSDGKTEYSFVVIYYIDENGEKAIELFPGCECEIIPPNDDVLDLDGSRGFYELIKNNASKF